jgi:hypothetical protein
MRKALLVVTILLLTSGIAFALPIAGTGQLGSFTGSFEYNSGKISVFLANTSPAANGGYLTAFAFGLPGSFTCTLDSAPGGFSLLGGSDGSISVSPFKDLDLGASATKGDWLGGGSPRGGLGVGQTGTFGFSLAGDFPGLTTDSFFGAGDPWIAVRFRGFENGGSDKVVPGNPVPEPVSMLLFGTGAVVFGGYIRRQHKKR